MNIKKINSVSLIPKKQAPLRVLTLNPEELCEIPVQLKKVDAMTALSQISHINFKGIYKGDDLGVYSNYKGPEPPQLELEKYHRSIKIQQDIENKNYLGAIEGKIELAKITKMQGKERDAFLLEESIRDLYRDLPTYQRFAAKRIIGEYNFDMAKYIDQDINR